MPQEKAADTPVRGRRPRTPRGVRKQTDAPRGRKASRTRTR
jgi:hypothetical protein